MPALLRNRRLDILHANTLGAALYGQAFEDPVRPPNSARYAFLDVRSKDFYVDWEAAARDMVGLLRAEAGRNPHDGALADLIAELSSRSRDFRTQWATHDVLFHRSNVRHFRHPLVGDVTLLYEDLDLPAEPAQTILVFAAEPGSTSEAALLRLSAAARSGQTSEDPG